MTIEVRQLVIRSSVGEQAAEARAAQGTISGEDVERLRQEILAECKAWVVDKLSEQRER